MQHIINIIKSWYSIVFKNLKTIKVMSKIVNAINIIQKIKNRKVKTNSPHFFIVLCDFLLCFNQGIFLQIVNNFQPKSIFL